MNHNIYIYTYNDNNVQRNTVTKKSETYEATETLYLEPHHLLESPNLKEK